MACFLRGSRGWRLLRAALVSWALLVPGATCESGIVQCAPVDDAGLLSALDFARDPLPGRPTAVERVPVAAVPPTWFTMEQRRAGGTADRLLVEGSELWAAVGYRLVGEAPVAYLRALRLEVISESAGERFQLRLPPEDGRCEGTIPDRPGRHDLRRACLEVSAEPIRDPRPVAGLPSFFCRGEACRPRGALTLRQVGPGVVRAGFALTVADDSTRGGSREVSGELAWHALVDFALVPEPPPAATGADERSWFTISHERDGVAGRPVREGSAISCATDVRPADGRAVTRVRSVGIEAIDAATGERLALRFAAPLPRPLGAGRHDPSAFAATLEVSDARLGAGEGEVRALRCGEADCAATLTLDAVAPGRVAGSYSVRILDHGRWRELCGVFAWVGGGSPHLLGPQQLAPAGGRWFTMVHQRDDGVGRLLRPGSALTYATAHVLDEDLAVPVLASLRLEALDAASGEWVGLVVGGQGAATLGSGRYELRADAQRALAVRLDTISLAAPTPVVLGGFSCASGAPGCTVEGTLSLHLLEVGDVSGSYALRFERAGRVRELAGDFGWREPRVWHLRR